MTSYEAQKRMALEKGNGPPILALYDDPDYVKANPAIRAVRELIIRGAYADLPVSQYPEIELVIHDQFHQFLMGNQDAKEAGQNMYEKIHEIMTTQ